MRPQVIATAMMMLVMILISKNDQEWGIHLISSGMTIAVTT